MNRILIFGAPGSGKGTISKFLLKDFGFTHIAAGDILRAMLASDSLEAREFKEIMSKGNLVPDEKITEIIKREIYAVEATKKSWLLDGYPRNIKQAKMLASFASTTLALNIEVPFPTITERLCDRVVHEPSGRIYNMKWNRPKVEGVDDVTGEPLTRRPDDSYDVVSRRLLSYEATIAPVLDLFRSQNKLKTFQGTESKVIYQSLHPFMETFLKSSKI
uniref:GTP:AMP phosphotransferase AK3, mitochondrial (Trinotate prediction) n=1 Tax=Myxobolus squamalis TaxID=59785 RepID=A0A6B2G8N7_MYXSQ